MDEGDDDQLMMPVWGDLPADVLAQIASFVPIPDLLRFSAVCTAWRVAAGEARRLNPFPCRRQLPWLMLPSVTTDELTATFFPAAPCGDGEKQPERHVLPVPLPSVIRRLCIGGGHGWVVTAGEPDEVLLLNPVTGSQIRLPPIGSFHKLIIRRISRQELRYPKAVLSANPSNGSYIVALVDYLPKLSLALFRSGEESWTIVSELTDCKEIFYHNGLLYMATKDGPVEGWDLDRPSPAKPVVFSPDPSHQRWHQRSFMYLAPSPWGDLLQVWWQMRPEGLVLEVYRVDLGSDKFRQVTSMGSHSLFLGGNQSICVSSLDVPEVRPNCIYFCDDCFDLPRSRNHEHLGVYDMNGGRIETVFPVDIRSTWQRPIWIRPSLV